MPDLKDESRGVKLNYMCQMFARCGYKFLNVESSVAYWYLLPDEVKSLSKLEVRDIQYKLHTTDHWSEYKNKLEAKYSINCFQEALVYGGSQKTS